MIEIQNLSKKFGRFTALDNVNLKLEGGHSIALIGPNGCGKTTLIKCVLNLNIFNSGKILIEGKSVKNNFIYRKNIGYMPQIGKYPDNMSIIQTIEMLKKLRGCKEKEYDEELIENFNLRRIFHKKMGTLSGGTMQKVSSVLAFLFNPSIIILDEPTAGLDPLASEILRKKILKEKENGKLILITSHLLSELNDIVDEIIFMNEGKLLFQKSVESLVKETNQKNIMDAVITVLKNMENND